jgi:hypothetical protein
MGIPPQQKLKSPVEALTRTTLPGLLSSCRQKLNTARFTVNEQLGPAVVVQVTVVTPAGKTLPEAGEHVTVPQVPVVVGAG